MKISLLVIRCLDVEASKKFYELLGLSFIKEKHGDGPSHYSCEHEGFVFELYPNKGELPKDNNRLGFNVADVASILTRFPLAESYGFAGKTIYVITDPDGRKIEISERENPGG